MKHIKPLSDRVIIKPFSAKRQSKIGVHIADAEVEKPNEGKVIAVGIGKPNDPMELKVGDTVVYSQHVGQKIKYKDEDLLILRESDVLFVV